MATNNQTKTIEFGVYKYEHPNL